MQPAPKKKQQPFAPHHFVRLRPHMATYGPTYGTTCGIPRDRSSQVEDDPKDGDQAAWKQFSELELTELDLMGYIPLNHHDGEFRAASSSPSPKPRDLGVAYAIINEPGDGVASIYGRAIQKRPQKIEEMTPKNGSLSSRNHHLSKYLASSSHPSWLSLSGSLPIIKAMKTQRDHAGTQHLVRPRRSPHPHLRKPEVSARDLYIQYAISIYIYTHLELDIWS